MTTTEPSFENWLEGVDLLIATLEDSAASSAAKAKELRERRQAAVALSQSAEKATR